MGSVYEVQIKDASILSGFTHMFPAKGKFRYFVSDANLEILKTAGVNLKVIKEIDTKALEPRIIYPFSNFLYSTPDQGAIDEICAKMMSSEKEGKLPYAIFLGRNPELQPEAFVLDTVGRNRHYQWKIVYKKEREKSLAETFPKLLRIMQDEDTKVVLSFGAGGLRFFAHASVIKFIDAIRARSAISEVWGCSGGAFSAYAFAMGVEPDDIEQKGYDIYNSRCNLKFAPSRLAAAKMRIVNTFFPTTPNLLKEYAQIQLMMRKALSQLVEDRQLEKPFYCTAYNVRLKHNDVLTPIPPKNCYKEFITHADPIESIVASSAIPIVFVPKVIQKGTHEEYYVDGSIAEDIPLLPVYRKWAVDRDNGIEKRRKLLILAINTFPEVADRPWLKRGLIKRVPFMDIVQFALRLFDLIMNIRFDERYESLSHDPKVKIIKVNLPLKTPALLDCRAIPTIIHNAQTNLISELLQVEGSL